MNILYRLTTHNRCLSEVRHYKGVSRVYKLLIHLLHSFNYQTVYSKNFLE